MALVFFVANAVHTTIRLHGVGDLWPRILRLGLQDFPDLDSGRFVPLKKLFVFVLRTGASELANAVQWLFSSRHCVYLSLLIFRGRGG